MGKDDNSVSRDEFLQRIWATSAFGSKTDLKNFFAVFCDELKNTLMEGKSFTLPGVGIFTVETSAPRSPKNVRTGEKMHIGERKRVKFSTAIGIRRHFREEAEKAESNNIRANTSKFTSGV